MRSGGGTGPPRGVAGLSLFFGFGALMALAAAVSLFFPGGPLEPMWRINPRGREGLTALGPWAPPLMSAVAAACAAAAIGLWRGRRWGFLVAVGILSVHAVADAWSALSGKEPAAIIGLPIAGAMLAYLVTRRVRAFFLRAS